MTLDSQAVDQAFQEAIEKKTFSGAQVLIGIGKKSLFSACYGRHSFESADREVQEDSLFDVASLTKPLVTATLALKALESQEFSLDQPVRDFFPQFVRKDEILLFHLLAHTSGLPAWLPLYKEVPFQGPSYENVQDRFIEEIHQVNLESRVGEKRIYSDLGFILLGFILEKVTGRRLDQLFRQHISEQLSMRDSFFNPLGHSVAEELMVVSGYSHDRKKILRGRVHDENASSLGGIAGHAGLFSNTRDIEKFVHDFWGHWREDASKKFFGPGVFPKLGWDTVSQPKSQAGTHFSEGSFGHLAFTGCSQWLDPVDKKYVILLTNRTLSEGPESAIKEFRPKIHDLLIKHFLQR